MAKISPTGDISVKPSSNLSISANPLDLTAGLHTGAQLGSGVRAGLDVGAGPGGIGVGPSLTIGQGEGSNIGGSVGGTAGAAAGAYFGGPIGSAIGKFVGSAIGSTIGAPFNKTKDQTETNQRKHVIKSFKEAGHLPEDYMLENPDGSKFNFDITEGSHPWKNPEKMGEKAGKAGKRELFNYEVDYTNDLDYASGMAGITLSRLLAGGTNKAIDQTGNAFGNAFLGKVGYGAEMTQDNFTNAMTNARAAYAQRGIKSKADMLALSNKMYSEGRVNDIDHSVAIQTADMVFDNNYNLALQLMSGRSKGVDTASAGGAAPQKGVNRPGRIYSPVISPEEAFLSVQPFFDEYRKRYPALKGSKGLGIASDISQGIGLVSAAAGAYKTIDKLSNGSLSSGLTDMIHQLGVGDVPQGSDYTLDPTLDATPDFSMESSAPSNDYQLDTTLDSGYTDYSF